MIDKTYCINLIERPDRWQKAIEQFDKHNLTVERVAGIPASDFKTTYPCSKANNGCTLAHCFIIERAKLLGLNAVMIFEDDAELHNDFNSILSEALNELPECWDLLYLGGNHNEMPVRFSNHLYRVSKTFCTHAYIIRNTLFDYVIDNFKTLHQPVDCYYVDKQREKNMFVVNPPLAWQRGGYSDIVGKNMDYGWIKKPIN